MAGARLTVGGEFLGFVGRFVMGATVDQWTKLLKRQLSGCVATG
jgi:hypothetical protein